MPEFTPPGLGWHRDLPDFRDYSPADAAVQNLMAPLPAAGKSARPEKVDLRPFFPPVCDQRSINASAAHACLGMLEYFQRRAHGNTVTPSRLFVHKTSRKLLNDSGDTGADLRTVLKAIVRCGVPPERYWPYDVDKVNDEPEAFLYSFAEKYRSLRYLRINAQEASGAQTLESLKAFLAAGFAVAFGFSVPSSLSSDEDILYRPVFDSILGGQAVVAVGYDDRRMRATRGAVLIRNSWGANWGEEGYGWLPYAFVESRMAADFWTLIEPDWIDSGEFSRPRLKHLEQAAKE